MQKKRHSLLLPLVLLAIALTATSAQAATLVEHNALPSVEQHWSAASFSNTLEPSGAPEFGRCIKTVGGAYENAGCTMTGSGKNYEWYSAFGSAQPLEKVGFSDAIKEGTVATLETINKNVITCEGETASGEYTGNKTIGNFVVSFSKCSAFGMSCKSEGAAAGTIVTYPLDGSLGIEELGSEASLNAIGEDLYPPGHSGPVGEFNCGGVPMTIAGSIISPVSDNAMKLTSTIKSKAVKGKQRPENFVSEPVDVLMTTINGGSAEQAGETLATIQTNEEKVEINSVL